jgi:hypothetical protein
MRNTYKVLAEMYEQQVNDVNVLQMPDGTVLNTKELHSLFAEIEGRMSDNRLYGEINSANVYDALRKGDVEGAAEEICFSFTDQDGGEADVEGAIKDVMSDLNHMIRNSKSAGTHPKAEAGKTEMEETFHVQDGETVLMSRTALPQSGDYLPAGTPAWVYYMARQATPEQIKALMGNIHSSVPGGYGSYKDDSMLPRGLRGKAPGVEDEGNEFTGDLAHSQKGDKFKIGGKTVTNTTGQIAEEVCPVCGMDLKGCKCAEKVYMAETTKPKVHMTGGDPKDPASAIKASKFSHHGG